MILCEISRNYAKIQTNRSYQIYGINEFKRVEIQERVYYINSNSFVENFLKKRENFINLKPYFRLNTIYEDLDVHRTAACYSIKDGVIISADSVITIDIMWRKLHLGGFVMSGISTMLDSYKSISSSLNRPFKSNIDLTYLPQKTDDAISYGILKPIVLTIKELAKNKKIYLTGPDGQYFLKYFENSIYDRDIIFNGLKNLIAQNSAILQLWIFKVHLNSLQLLLYLNKQFYFQVRMKLSKNLELFGDFLESQVQVRTFQLNYYNIFHLLNCNLS